MITNRPSTVSVSDTPSLWARGASFIRWAAMGASLAVFVARFDPTRKQVEIDLLWVLALALWIIEWRARNRGRLLDIRWQWREMLPLAVILVLFVVAWVPFYHNWRWAYTGDGWGLFAVGYDWARQWPHKNLLSVHGIDNSFSVLFTFSYSTLMAIVEPTFLWHRLTGLVFACGAVTAIYAFCTLTLGPLWASAVALAIVTNHVWLWFSYVSYGKMDSYIFYFCTLFLATCMWRAPDCIGAWVLCGVVGGLSLFFTPTAWSAVMAVGVVFGVWALMSRRFVTAAVYAASFLLAATPILLQFADFLHMIRHQARSVYEWAYLWRIFRTIVVLAYYWDYHNLGVQGAFIHWPLGSLYVVGCVLSALALIPTVRRWLRVPTVAVVLLGLLLWDAVLMTLTNNGYGMPSTKRIYSLIPLQVILSFVPLVVLDAWSAQRRWMHWSVVAAAAALLGTYAVANLRLIIYPAPRVYGVNIFDGLIELRQRFPERRVVLFSKRDEIIAWITGPKALLGRVYELTDTVSVQSELASDQLRLLCAPRSIGCYESPDAATYATAAAPLGACLKPFPLLNSTELHCVECDPTACAAG